jgi:uncharacterized GH25 family protein
MKRLSYFLISATAFGLLSASPLHAHFVWLLPRETRDKARSVGMIFSEDTRPDRAELLKKIAPTEVFVRDSDGKTTALKTELGKDAWQASLPDKGFHEIGGVCRYGVVQHVESEPFLLNYYAKTFVGLDDWGHPPALFGKAWDKLPLEIVPVLPKRGAPQLRVLWQGKPLADAQVVLQVPGSEESVEVKTDKDGMFPLSEPNKGGLYGIRVGHKEERKGALDGKKYKEIRHYATLVLAIPAGYEPTSAGDPRATKLLADARAARALYHDFPGFRADIAVNIEGDIKHGQVEVSGAGKVTLKLDDAEAAKWAKSTLGSIVGHRLSGGPDEETPCAFVDEDEAHPLGRAIRVLNDEFHSSYRIRDRQVIVVNRQVPGARFTITVMENVATKEKKFLPACYVVNTWNAKTEALMSSETHHQTWQRVGAFDLPKETQTVKATNGKLEARSIKLSKIQLK